MAIASNFEFSVNYVRFIIDPNHPMFAIKEGDGTGYMGSYMLNETPHYNFNYTTNISSEYVYKDYIYYIGDI